MASALPNTLVNKKLAIDNVSWTAIAAPLNCNSLRVSIGGTSDVKIRTDSGDANTEKAFATGTEWSPVDGAATGYDGQAARFQSGQTVAYAQAVTGTGPLYITGIN